MSGKVLYLLFTILLISASISASEQGNWGIRGGIGTDITGGIAYGGTINYHLPYQAKWIEIGFVLFGSHSEETTEEFHTYIETTDLFVYGILGNYLYNYDPGKIGTYYIVGIGLAVISVEWEERSDTDVSLGTLLANGGSKQSAEGTAVGTVLNFGIGYNFSGNLDGRIELPIIIIAGAPGEASSVAPAITITVGFRFK